MFILKYKAASEISSWRSSLLSVLCHCTHGENLCSLSSWYFVFFMMIALHCDHTKMLEFVMWLMLLASIHPLCKLWPNINKVRPYLIKQSVQLQSTMVSRSCLWWFTYLLHGFSQLQADESPAGRDAGISWCYSSCYSSMLHASFPHGYKLLFWSFCHFCTSVLGL